MIARLTFAFAAFLLLAFLIYESVVYGWVAAATVIVFAVLPDVALIRAFDRARPGMLRPARVAFYNLVHRPWIALALVAVGALLVLPPVGGLGDGGKLIVIAGLAWLLHITTDRAFGYGLRAADGGIRPVAGTRTPQMCQA